MDTLEHDLADRLHRIGDRVAVPPTAAEGDVLRGRRRLRRTRALAATGSALAVTGVAGALGLAGGPGPAAAPEREVPAAAPAAPAAPANEVAPARGLARAALELAEAPGDRAVGALDLDPAEVTAAAEALEEVVGDQRWFHLSVGGGTTWAQAGAAGCPDGWTCEQIEVDGASRAKTASRAGTVQLAAEFAGGVLVLTVAQDRLADDLPLAGGDDDLVFIRPE